MLTKDIDMNGSVWTPIEDFSGVLTSMGEQNFTISNYKLVASPNDQQTDLGLFKNITTTGVVKNINLSNVTILGEPYQEGTLINIGALAGVSEGKIQNLNRGQSSLGGLVGYNKGEINSSRVEQSYLFNNGDVGGVAGTSTGSIKDTTVGNLEIIHWGSAKNNKKSVGGIVAYNLGLVENSGSTEKNKFEYKGTAYSSGFLGIGGVDIYPKFGYIVGHNSDVGILNNIYISGQDKKKNTGGCHNKYFFSGDGTVGRDD